jgi:hypothetical protein
MGTGYHNNNDMKREDILLKYFPPRTKDAEATKIILKALELYYDKEHATRKRK